MQTSDLTIRRFELVALLFILCVSSVNAQDYKVREVKDAGSIKGRVFFPGKYPEVKPLRVPAVYRRHCGRTKPNEEFIISPKTKGLKNVVIYIEGIKAGKAFPKLRAKLEQKECRYEPHVQIIPSGTTLEIVNQDKTLHNVHSYLDPDGKRTTLFNVAQPTKGKKHESKLMRVGLVKIVCDIHRWMGCFVVVRDNPYYALSDENGGYEITGIPPGKYKVILWHEGLGTDERTVVVKSGKAVDVSFPIGRAEGEAKKTTTRKGRIERRKPGE